MSKQTRELLFKLYLGKGFSDSLTEEQKQDFLDSQFKSGALAEAEAKLDALIQAEYQKGYNDNARNCYCDSPGATQGVIPHHHLITDGESHDIRPDIAQLQERNKQ